jgi:hypothetical protein
MIARLNGKTWRNVQAATPGVPSYQINLGDVTTLSPTDAWAVGQTFGADHSASRRHPKLSVVILHWNGTDWTPIAVPGLSSLGTSVHN